MVLILGVTASGKGRLAFRLAESLGAEIISIDSMKVYRRMNIGTGKPTKENRERIRHHLIDVVEPSESFSVGAFLDLANVAIEQIKGRNKPIVAVGGTALYIKALLYGLFEGPGTDKQIRAELQSRAEAEGLTQLYRELSQIDPVACERISPNDAKRIIRALEVYRLTGKPISSFQKQWKTEDRRQRTEDRRQKTEDRRQRTDEGRSSLYLAPRSFDLAQDRFTWGSSSWTIIGLRREKSEENKRINARVKKMIAAGLVDEVKSLLSEEKQLSPQAQCAIGYAEIIDYLNGRQTFEEAVELIKKHTRQLAKSQRTWFRTFPDVHWLDIEAEESSEKIFDRTKQMLDDIK